MSEISWTLLASYIKPACSPPSREKRQLSVDLVAAGRYEKSDVQEGREQAWKLKSRYGFGHEYEASISYDLSFFQISSESGTCVDVQ